MTNSFGLVFDHLGLATRAPDDSVRFLVGLDYAVGEIVHDPLQRVHLRLCRHQHMPTVEMVWPGGENSPVDSILARTGTGLYHSCYRSADLAATQAAIRASGLRLLTVVAPTPAVLFGGLFVSFHMLSGMGLVEIIEDPHMAGSGNAS